MERIPPHNLNAEELLALVLRLQVLEVSNREKTQGIERQAKRSFEDLRPKAELGTEGKLAVAALPRDADSKIKT